MVLLRYCLVYVLEYIETNSSESTFAVFLWLIDLNAVVRFLRMTLVVDNYGDTVR